MHAALLAGLAYFGSVFAVGFILGTLRVLVVVPRLGELAAVLVELPVMLAVSWFACRWLVFRLRVPNAIPACAAMGGLAFTLLIAAEFALGTILFGRSAAEHVSRYAEPANAAGLAAQILFATFPLWTARRV